MQDTARFGAVQHNVDFLDIHVVYVVVVAGWPNIMIDSGMPRVLCYATFDDEAG